MELLRGVSAAKCWRSFHFYLSSFLIVDHDPAAASATPPGCRKPITRIVAEQRDELAPFHCPMPPVLPTERIAHLGTETAASIHLSGTRRSRSRRQKFFPRR